MPSILDRLQYTLKQYPSIRRLYRRVMLRRQRERASASLATVDLDGLRFRVDDDVQMRLNYQDPAYFADFRKVVQDCVQPGDVVFDIGAHAGVTAAILVNRVGPDGAVYAFEPSPTLHALLRANVESNGLANVHPVQVALSAQSGSIEFFLSRTHSGYNSMSADNAMAFTSDPADVKRISVATRALDEFARGEGVAPSFLKIDTQGAEFEILQGAQGFFAGQRARPVHLYLEFYPDAITSISGASGDDMLDLLEGMGLSILSADPFDRYLENGRVPAAARREFLDNVRRHAAGYVNLLLRSS